MQILILNRCPFEKHLSFIIILFMNYYCVSFLYLRKCLLLNMHLFVTEKLFTIFHGMYNFTTTMLTCNFSFHGNYDHILSRFSKYDNKYLALAVKVLPILLTSRRPVPSFTSEH